MNEKQGSKFEDGSLDKNIRLMNKIYLWLEFLFFFILRA